MLQHYKWKLTTKILPLMLFFARTRPENSFSELQFPGSPLCCSGTVLLRRLTFPPPVWVQALEAGSYNEGRWNSVKHQRESEENQPNVRPIGSLAKRGVQHGWHMQLSGTKLYLHDKYPYII